MAPPDDSHSLDEAPEGFDEIERAFANMSNFADNLLDSINDDSERVKERRKERKREASKRHKIDTPTHNYVTDSDDEMKDDTDHNHSDSYDDIANLHSYSYGNSGHDSDVSTLASGDLTYGGDGDDSVDGSLIHDVHNLKSITKAMREEMQKQEEAFHANVTTDNGQSFFQKLEDAKAAEDAKALKTPKIRNVARPSMLRDAPKTISVRNTSHVPILSSTPKPKSPSLLEQLRQFCDQVLGKRPNLSLLVANMVLWLLLFKMVVTAKDQLIDENGMLRLALAN